MCMVENGGFCLLVFVLAFTNRQLLVFLYFNTGDVYALILSFRRCWSPIHG
jgi:hypothetical protein